MVDQAAGGLIMWVPGSLFFLVVLSVVFFKWVGADSDEHGAARRWTGDRRINQLSTQP